jgi:LPS O-antigen subunit length determinant protein (WzzB/FepE family)
VMYKLIESETKTLMLANGRKDYAFAVIDSAVAPEIRTSPRRTLMVLLGTVLGFFVGVMISLARDAWVRRRQRTELSAA